MQEIIDKAATLLEALPYIQRFRDKVFVIKYGGSFMESPDPSVRNDVIRDIVFLEAVGINPVVVHGGGKAITRAMERDAKFVQGMRVTSKATIEIVERVLSREINPEIVGTIKQFGGNARGFSGTEIFTCQKLDAKDEKGKPVDLGFVGEVVDVDTDPLWACIDNHITPVISPTASDKEGRIYNCNADLAATQTAIALNARRLVFMSDVPGLLRDPSDLSSVIPHLKVDEVQALKDNGVIAQGMLPKVDNAVKAVRTGVDKVSLVDGRMPHAIMLEIFTDKGVGTELVL